MRHLFSSTDFLFHTSPYSFSTNTSNPLSIQCNRIDSDMQKHLKTWVRSRIQAHVCFKYKCNYTIFRWRHDFCRSTVGHTCTVPHHLSQILLSSGIFCYFHRFPGNRTWYDDCLLSLFPSSSWLFSVTAFFLEEDSQSLSFVSFPSYHPLAELQIIFQIRSLITVTVGSANDLHFPWLYDSLELISVLNILIYFFLHLQDRNTVLSHSTTSLILALPPSPFVIRCTHWIHMRSFWCRLIPLLFLHLHLLCVHSFVSASSFNVPVSKVELLDHKREIA